jgi:hypothetical protein
MPAMAGLATNFYLRQIVYASVQSGLSLASVSASTPMCSTTSGRRHRRPTRSHFSDGRVSDTVYKPGDFKQITFKEGEFMVHHLENIGDTELLFTTVEFLESPNAPLGPCHANVSAHPVVG